MNAKVCLWGWRRGDYGYAWMTGWAFVMGGCRDQVVGHGANDRDIVTVLER